MTQTQLPKNIIKMFDNVQNNGIDYKTEETAVSPSAQQILAENRESAQTVLQSSIEQEIGQEVKAVELNGTLHNVKDESARNNILKEVSTRAREITRVEGLIESEASTRANADTTLNNNINTINSKIPSQASSTNQLADKDFVNSSIATNTANFIGTFTDIEELKRQPATNNDYAFWLTTDSAGNILFKRYKYIASTNSWVFEYDLNNSSFTSEQWLAIQSGITAVLVAKLKGIEEGAQVNTITGVKGGNESSYRTGNVNITKDNVGLGNVGNFKAVSTVASQGLSATEQSNARANIGAGTYSKPDTGIPKTSLASDVQTSLEKADTALQSHQDISRKLEVTGSNGTAVGVSALLNKLTTGDAIPSDSDYFISQYANGGTTNTTFHRRPINKLWDYIKSKADSVYAKLSHTHTKSQITDFPTSLPANGGTADTATKATEVLDYADTSRTVKVGYSGPSIKNNDLLALAGYTERTDSSVKLKDVNKTELAKWLGLGSAPYINTLDIAISSEVSVTMNTFTSSAINAPVATDGLVITHHLSSTKATQLALCGAQLFTRTYSNSTWSAWTAMWNTEES